MCARLPWQKKLNMVDFCGVKKPVLLELLIFLHVCIKKFLKKNSEVHPLIYFCTAVHSFNFKSRLAEIVGHVNLWIPPIPMQMFVVSKQPKYYGRIVFLTSPLPSPYRIYSTTLKRGEKTWKIIYLPSRNSLNSDKIPQLENIIMCYSLFFSSKRIEFRRLNNFASEARLIRSTRDMLIFFSVGFIAHAFCQQRQLDMSHFSLLCNWIKHDIGVMFTLQIEILVRRGRDNGIWWERKVNGEDGFKSDVSKSS